MPPDPHPHRFHRRLAAALLLPLVVAACSLPTDKRVTPYNPADLPGDLTNTTTTTTTTTTVPVSVATTVDDGSTPEESTTTVAAPLTSPVEIYYTLGFSDDMQPVRRDLIAPVPISNVISQLETPLEDVALFGLRSSVRTGLIDEVVLDRAIATVVLDAPVLERLSNNEQRRAIAQIVLTLTSFVTADAGAIGFVRFEVDGEGFPVFVPSLGGTSDPGEPLAFVDFADYVVDTSLTERVSSTTTTPTTTTTTTTTTSTPATTTTTTEPTADAP
jgi:hypothetical protein